MELTLQQKRHIAIATGLGLIVLQRKRLRQGEDGGASSQSNLQGEFARQQQLDVTCLESLPAIEGDFRPFHAAARRCWAFVMDYVPLMRLSADELSQFVRDLRPEVAFTLFHDVARPGNTGPAPELEVSAQLDLAEPFQDGGSQSIMGHLEAACLLTSSDRQSISGPLYERLSLRLQHAELVKPGLIEAATVRILVYVLLERPTRQEVKRASGLEHIVHVLNQVGEEQDGRWRWEVLDGLYAAVQRFGQRLSENVDTVPVAVLDSCAMILHALEELTLARLRDDASMLDALLERLISLTRLFRPLQLGEAYLWSIVNKVKALVLEQEEALDSS